MSYFINYDTKSNEFEKIPISTTNYFQTNFQIPAKIAESNFSEVFRVCQNGTEYAVKRLKKVMSDDYDRLLCYQEIKALTMVGNSPNCVKLYEAWEEEAVLYMKMELCKDNSKPIDFGKLLSQILKGLEDLHSKNFVHRDLKGDNVLIGRDGYYKIIDFGMACETNERELYLQDVRQVALLMKEISFGIEVDREALIKLENMLWKLST